MPTGELISSDGIAFYELIKNAFDAGSKKVHSAVSSTRFIRLHGASLKPVPLQVAST